MSTMLEETASKKEVLSAETVVLGARAADKSDAIRQAGEALARAGCIAPPYIDGMLAREQALSTYLGNGIALPHGESDDLRWVLRTGVSVVQLPAGVEWDPGETVHLIVGLAATPTSSQHASVLVNLLEVLQDSAAIRQLAHTTDPMVVVERLTRSHSEQRSEAAWN